MIPHLEFYVDLSLLEDEKLKEEIKEYIYEGEQFEIYMDGDFIIVEGEDGKYELLVWKLDPLRENLFKKLWYEFSEDSPKFQF